MSAAVDTLLKSARQRLGSATPREVFSIKRASLEALVEEIERLRAAIGPLPDQNMVGQHHSKAQATERAAAWAVLPRSGTQRMTVLRAIVNSDDGLTDSELEQTTGIYQYSAAPRRNELVNGGWVKDSGRTRETQRNADAAVWVATEKALAMEDRINS